VVMGEQRTDWNATKKMLSRPDLLEKMLSIASKDAIDASTLTALHGYIEMPGFAPEQVANVSKAAHNLCLWIHGVYKHQGVVAGERGTPLVLSPVVALAGKAGMAGGAGAASSKDRSSKDRPVKDRSSHDRPTTATALRSRPTTATARISRPTTASARLRTNDLCNTPSNTSKGTTRKLHDSPGTRLLLVCGVCVCVCVCVLRSFDATISLSPPLPFLRVFVRAPCMCVCARSLHVCSCALSAYVSRTM